MTRYWSLILGAVVFVGDLTTKWWVENTLGQRPDPRYKVIEEFLTIHYMTNEGIAFGFFQEESAWKTPILTGIAILAMAMIFYYVLTTPLREKLLFLAFGLLLGGITGNFVDRLVNGRVVDFIKVHWGTTFAWPTFNIADSAITTGVVLILLTSFFGNDNQTKDTGPSPSQ